jgi:DNA-binding NarL/FixJ family response regulator
MNPTQSEIERLRGLIAALQAKLRPLMREQKKTRTREAAERRLQRLEERRARIARMVELHQQGVSYRDIALQVGLSRDYVADLVMLEERRKRTYEQLGLPP